jgi:hypothetical protein
MCAFSIVTALFIAAPVLTWADRTVVDNERAILMSNLDTSNAVEDLLDPISEWAKAARV